MRYIIYIAFFAIFSCTTRSFCQKLHTYDVHPEEYDNQNFNLNQQTNIATTLALENEITFPFFDGSFNELQQTAKENNKPYFVYFNAIWCGPCRQVKSNILTNKTLISLSENENLAYSIDVEDFEGIEISQKYNVKQLPYFIFFNPDQTVAGTITGYISPDTFIKKMNEYFNK